MKGLHYTVDGDVLPFYEIVFFSSFMRTALLHLILNVALFFF